jgi:hypothetical protein
MLEHRALLFSLAGPDGVRAIVDASSGMPLGFARPARGGSWWWLSRPVLEVHEHEDAPLLFTVWRRWGWLRRQDIRDADGHLVGFVTGLAVRDPRGRLLAERRPGSGAAFVLLGQSGCTLAQADHNKNGLRVTFAPELDAEPFVKMLLLGAVLAE